MTYTISTLNNDPGIRDNLLHEMDFLKREGIQVDFAEETKGKFLFINCSIRPDEDEPDQSAHEKTLRYYLAYIITDMLLNGITKEIMGELVKQHYRYLDKDDWKAVIQTAYSLLNNLHSDGEIEKTLSRYHFVLAEVTQYLDANESLFLEGFLRFRLKEYFLEMEQSLERAVDSFLVEQEYHQFIRMLRYFVDVQEPRIEEVQVLVRDKQSFYLLDEENQPIFQNQLQSILLDLNQEVDYEDLLLSALITLAPRRIILHVIHPIEMVETISNIFCERVRICQGCEVCTEEGIQSHATSGSEDLKLV